MWPATKFDPPLQITNKQRAAARPWATLQLRLMVVGLISTVLLVAYVGYTVMSSRTNWYIVAIWYMADSLFLTSSAYYCSYHMSRIVDDDGQWFNGRVWLRIFLRPFVVVGIMYALWHFGRAVS